MNLLTGTAAMRTAQAIELKRLSEAAFEPETFKDKPSCFGGKPPNCRAVLLAGNYQVDDRDAIRPQEARQEEEDEEE
jgi:hypothetical protein